MAPTEIDISIAAELRRTLLNSAANGHSTAVLDMTGARFCDSAACAVLVKAHRRALAEGSQPRLVIPVGGSVAHVVDLTGISRLIAMFSSAEKAVSTISGATILPLHPRPSREIRNHPSRGGRRREGAQEDG